MSPARTILVTLFLIGSAFLSTGGTAAKEGGPGKGPHKPPQARVTWNTSHLEQTVNPGQTVDVTATLTSSTDLTNVTLRVPGGLGRVLTVEPATISSLKAGVAIPIKLTMTMPTTGAHTQGGVVQVRTGQRNLPAGLNITLTVPSTADGDTEEGDD